MELKRQKIGFFLGPFVLLLILLLPPPMGMEMNAWRVSAVTALMAIWWMTEAVPLAATSLLPIILFPCFNIMSSSKATAPYGHSLIFLFMGGFFIAMAMEKWNLHKRISLTIIEYIGLSPQRLILGFMCSSYFISAWITNTATTMMMVPIAIAIISQITKLSPSELAAGKGQNYNFAIALMLGIAWSASLGGMSTIIGTAPNLVMVSQIQKFYNVEIDFLQWMLFGVPVSLMLLFATWFLLTKILFKFDDFDMEAVKKIFHSERALLKKSTKEEKILISVGLFVISLWILRGIFKGWLGIHMPYLKEINDTTIGMFGAMLLFIIPSNFSKNEFILDWATAVKIPWGVILLFGGGLSLAQGFQSTGLTLYLASSLASLEGVSLILFLLIVVALIVFLTEITSNTAIATLLIPVMGACAISLAIHPFGPIVAACVAASCAFMLPVATPPNAIVFGSGCISIPQMSRSGAYLNIIAIIVITLCVTYLLPVVWNIDLTQTPEEFLKIIQNKQQSFE